MDQLAKTDAFLQRFETYEKWTDELTKFTNALKALPAQTDVRVNAQANDSKYIPIGSIEEKLDYYFFGLWNTTDFHYSVIVNEVVCHLQLEVLHPQTGFWIKRVGVAGTQIQLKKGSDVTDVSAKIANTLGKDFPHAKAEAIKNAAKSLGNIFGRNLNRGPQDAALDIVTVEDAEIRITSMETQAELAAYFKSLPVTMQSDKRIRTLLKTQERFIKENAQK